MMILKIFFTPDEIKDFFQRNGFEVKQHTFGRWESGHNNRSDWVEYEDLAVIIDGKAHKANELFEQSAELKLKRIVTPENAETKRAILRMVKQKQQHGTNC